MSSYSHDNTVSHDFVCYSPYYQWSVWYPLTLCGYCCTRGIILLYYSINLCSIVSYFFLFSHLPFFFYFFFFKQKTAYEMRISDWSSDVCSSDLHDHIRANRRQPCGAVQHARVFGGDRHQPPPPLARCAHDPFQRPIDRLGRAAGEEHALGLLVQYRCDLCAGHLHRRIGFAPVTMRRMGIAEAILQIGHHSGSRFGRERRCCLIIEVDRTSHAASTLALICNSRHAARKQSISAMQVCGANETRMTSRATSGSSPIAASTWLGFIEPDEQAAPADTAIPARSKWMSWVAAGTPAMRSPIIDRKSTRLNSSP